METKHPYNQNEDADLDTELEDGEIKELGADEEKPKIPGIEEADFDELEELEEADESDTKEL